MNQGIHMTMHTVRLTLLSLLAGGLASSLEAQVSVKAYAHTKLTAGTQSIPRDTDVSTGADLWYSPGGSCRSSASLRVDITGAAVRMQCGSSSYCSSAPGANGSIRIQLTASKATTGFLVVDGDCPGSRSGFSVDVGNNGTLDLQDSSQFRGQRMLETPLVVGPSGVWVIVSCYAANYSIGSSAAGAGLTVRFVTGSSTPHLKLVGTSCGPELTVRFTQTVPFFPVSNFTMIASKATQTSSWFIFGLTQRNIPLPPTGCKLYTDVVVPFWTVVNATGESSLNIPVPRGTSGAQMYVQFLQATFRSNQMEWTTSQALQLRL